MKRCLVQLCIVLLAIGALFPTRTAMADLSFGAGNSYLSTEPIVAIDVQVGTHFWSRYGRLCYGWMIAPTKILTAADCVWNFPNQTFRYFVYRWPYNFKSEPIKIERVDFAPNLQLGTLNGRHSRFKNDIAVLTARLFATAPFQLNFVRVTELARDSSIHCAILFPNGITDIGRSTFEETGFMFLPISFTPSLGNKIFSGMLSQTDPIVDGIDTGFVWPSDAGELDSRWGGGAPLVCQSSRGITIDGVVTGYRVPSSKAAIQTFGVVSDWLMRQLR